MALGAAALVLLAALLQPWWLAPLASHQLSSSARRPVHFDSMWVGLSARLEPVVTIQGIRIENAPWADAGRPFAVLGVVRAVFSWRSLEERRPVLALVVLRDGQVDLERRADGLRNWRLGRPDDRGPGRYKVLAVQADNATVRFRHERIDLELEATARRRGPEETSAEGAGAGATAAPAGSAPPGDEPLPTQVEVRGRWRGVPFAISAATSEALTFLETRRMFRLRGQASAGATRLDVDGHAGDFLREPLLDARVDLVAPSLAPFAEAFPALPAEARAIRLSGHVRGEPGRYAFTVANGRLGSTDLAGEIGWTRGDERDAVRARISSESAHLADLRSLAGRGRAAAARAQTAAAASAASSPASGVAAAGPDAGRSRPLDFELGLAARRLRVAALPWLQSAQIDASLADGRLSVPRFDLGIAQGHAVGKGTVDVTSRPRRGEFEVDLRAIRIESLLADKAAANLLSGTLQGRAVLKASGDSSEALLSSAVGTVSAFVSGGTISSLLDAQLGLQGGKLLRSYLSGSEPIGLRCAAATLELDRGAGRIRSLVIDTERTRTTGSGRFDLGAETVDVVLTPQAKQEGLFNLERSIRLHGALRRPKKELIARAEVAGSEPRHCVAEAPRSGTAPAPARRPPEGRAGPG